MRLSVKIRDKSKKRKFLLSVIALLLSMVMVGFAGWVGFGYWSIRQNWIRAQAAFEAGQLDSSEELLKPLCRNSAYQKKAIGLLAVIHEQRKQFKAAAVCWGRLSSLDFGNREFRRRHSRALLLAGQYVSLIEQNLPIYRGGRLDIAETFDLCEALILSKGNSHFEIGRELYAKLSAANAFDDRLRLFYAFIELKSGRMDKARLLFQQPLRQQDIIALKWLAEFGMAKLCLEAEEAAEAEPHILTALQLLPERTFLPAARYYLGRNRLKEARKFFEKELFFRTPNFSVVAELSEIYARQKDVDALLVLRDSFDVYQKDALQTRYYIEGIIAYLRHDLGEAGRKLAWVQLYNLRPYYLYMKLSCDVARGEVRDALFNARRILTEEHTPETRRNVIDSLQPLMTDCRRRKQTSAAIDIAEFLLPISDGGEERRKLTELLIGDLLVERNYLRAEKLAKSILSEEPTSTSALEAMSQVCYEEARYSEALEWLDRLPRTPRNVSRRCSVLELLGRGTEAKRFFADVWAKDRQDPELLEAYVEFLKRNGQMDELLAVTGSIPERGPLGIFALLTAADVEFSRGNQASAQSLYRRSVELLLARPESARRNYRLGICYLRLGEYERSADLLEEFVRQNPRWVEALIALSDASAGAGRRERAQECARLALSLKPDWESTRACQQRRLAEENAPKL